MKRAFASQAEFDTWHASAKAAAGLPIVGTNAATGEPQPGKQQTTAYTSVGPAEVDIDGNVIDPTLVATVGDERLVARGLVDGLIRADLLTAAEVAELASAYPSWESGGTYALNALREHGGILYKCVQPHTNNDPSHTPDVTPALWTPAAPEGVLPEWVQPTGAQDAYQAGVLVTHPDRANTMGTGADTVWVWRSTYDGNTTEPGQDGQFHRYWEPIEQA